MHLIGRSHLCGAGRVSSRTVIHAACLALALLSTAVFVLRSGRQLEQPAIAAVRGQLSSRLRRGTPTRRATVHQGDAELASTKTERRAAGDDAGVVGTAPSTSRRHCSFRVQFCRDWVLKEPRFADFPAYRWPNASQLMSESPLRVAHVASTASADRSRDEREAVTLAMTQNLSCAAVPRWRGDDGHSPLVVTRPAAHGAPRSVVRLFVPWGSFTYMTPHPLQCPAVTCELTNAKSDIANVDAYVVDSNGAYITEHYDWVRNPLRKVLVAFNTENIEGRRVGLRKGYGIRYLAKPWNATWWRHFHVVASYHTGAHVVVNFFHWSLCRDSSFVAGYRHWETAGKRRSAAAGGIAGGAPRGVLAAKTRRGASVLFFVRNCDFAAHRRAGFMRRLQQHIAIDSVGKCENNRQQEEVRACSGLATNRRSCIIADYRFYLAIENSISLDYVSEKVYEALLVGTIPIYLGAPNAADFMPARHSAIMARDFASLAQLAAYVRCIEGNRSLYEYYTAWHTRPLLPRFAAEIAGGAGRDAPLCQVCSAVAAARARVAEKRVKERDAAADGAATADGAGGTLAMREAVLAQFDDDATWRSRRVPGVSEELWDLENSQAPLAQCLVGV